MRYVRVGVPPGSGSTIDTELVDLATDLLWCAGVSAIEERESPDGTVVLVADVDLTQPGGRSLADDLARLPGVTVEADLADPDAWHEEWRRHAPTVVISDRLVVRPPWVASPRPDLPEVRIDPAGAWGHGAHVTTRLALRLLLDETLAGRSLLDVGCGSGVLAIAAAAEGAGPVVAVDIDEAALAATRANADANGFAVEVQPSLSAVDGTFDLVVANIEASALRALVSDIAQRVNASGGLILSGLLTHQVGDVTGRLPDTDSWTVERLVDEEGWAAVRLSRR